MRLAIVIAAAVLLALPAATIARPIEEASRAETLVEGHTVFLTIDAWLPNESATSSAVPLTARQRSASLVDEPVGHRETSRRFPGVLWTNDQYLVAPSQSFSASDALGHSHVSQTSFAASLAVLVRSDEGNGVREPCGGAVLAVNAGEADPRPFLDPEFALDWTYLASYRVTDPNAHAWFVDKYELALPQPHLVWVVNILGAPTFVPDADGTPLEDCVDLKDLLDDMMEPAAGATCGIAVEESDPFGTTSNPDVSASASFGAPAWSDRPCMGWMEPSRNGYCYHGPAATDEDLDGDVDAEDCWAAQEVIRHRRYNALLYFDWADLSVAGAPADHSDPVSDISTNACQSRTEWSCPWEVAWEAVDGAESFEGASHAFHPLVPPHEEAEPCAMQFAGPNPANHAGSTYGVGGWAPCDYAHATAMVEVYYSGSARPLEPGARFFDVEDGAGESDPYFDFHQAYPWTWP